MGPLDPTRHVVNAARSLAFASSMLTFVCFHIWLPLYSHILGYSLFSLSTPIYSPIVALRLFSLWTLLYFPIVDFPLFSFSFKKKKNLWTYTPSRQHLLLSKYYSLNLVFGFLVLEIYVLTLLCYIWLLWGRMLQYNVFN